MRGVEGRIWCEMGEGVFIGPGSNGCLAKGANVQYYYPAIQGLSHTSRYYPTVNPKSSLKEKRGESKNS
jgi:hypothetical protein